MALHFPREYFALNHAFAVRVTELTGCPLAEAYLKYTQLYLVFGLERVFDPADPAWVSFLEGAAQAGDPVAWIEDTFHRLRDHEIPRPRENAFGCFSFAVWDGGRIRLHFFSGGNPAYSPLARANLSARLDELTALFRSLKKDSANARTVVGGSWLYNIEAYRRLFPSEFLRTAAPEETECQFVALWGQFIGHDRQVKPDLARRFLASVACARSMDDLLHAFPYPVLRLECPIDVFYRHYGIAEEA